MMPDKNPPEVGFLTGYLQASKNPKVCVVYVDPGILPPCRELTHGIS